MTAVGRRYARAAVLAAEEKGGAAVEALAQGLTAFYHAYRDSDELRELLHNPVFIADREKVLGLVLGQLQISGEAENLIRLLADRDRVAILQSVADEVEAIADDHAGRLRADVTSAMPLTDSQTGRIADALERRLGKTVVVDVSIDPEILGGLVCRVGDLTLDSSLRRQLAHLREQLEKHA